MSQLVSTKNGVGLTVADWSTRFPKRNLEALTHTVNKFVIQIVQQVW